MTRYLYAFTTATGPLPLRESDFDISYTVDWDDDGTGRLDDFSIEAIDGKLLDKAESERVTAHLAQYILTNVGPAMIEAASVEEGEREAERQDRRDEDAYERAWAE